MLFPTFWSRYLSERTMVLSLIAGAALCFSASAQSQSAAADHIAGRLLVQHRPGSDFGNDEKVLKDANLKVVKRIEPLRISVLSVPEAAVEQITKHLKDTGKFTFVEQDFTARGAILSNDPSATTQWHLTTINAPSAWNISTGSTSVPIAVVDSGVDGSHPDLAGKIIPGWNFLGANSNTSDVLGHGTAVAGVAGAATDNGIGVAGVGWRTPIMPLVVLNSSDFAAYSDVANGIIYAADHGIRIINVSICGTAASSTLQGAVDYAWNKGSLVFAAAGNSGTSTLTYPAACARAIAVSSTEKNDTLSSFSNRGSWIDLSAPGNYILTTKMGGSYSQWRGTSFASPIAASVAALALSVRPTMDRDTLLRILEENTDDLGSSGFDTSFGWGRVNAYKTVAAAAAISSDISAPTVTIAAPAPSTLLSGMVAVSGSATDSSGVSKCDLYIDNALTGSQGAAFTFDWDSRNIANGVHTLLVRCSDSAANVGQASITVSVDNVTAPDVQAPTVIINSPTPNAKVTGQVTISVSATDNVGVSQVSIYVDGVQVSSGASASLTYTWSSNKSTSGPHTITAKAWDRAGNVAAKSITVTR
jgi:thermitase